MDHSFVQAHRDEEAAFESFARSWPDNAILLIDTYDTEAAAQKIVRLVPRLARDSIHIRGVRLDSGDLLAHARKVRRILDEGGLREMLIFASGGLFELQIQHLTQAGAPIDGSGVGTALTSSLDAASLDCAYKIQEYAGRPRRKRSEGKATWRGRKQVFRRYDAAGRMVGDTITIDGDTQPGVALVTPIMRAGARLSKCPTLTEARSHAKKEFRSLPDSLRKLEHASYPVELSPSIRALAEEVDAESQ